MKRRDFWRRCGGTVAEAAHPTFHSEKVCWDFFLNGSNTPARRLGLARRIQCASAVPTTMLSERSRTLHFAPQMAPGPSILHPKRSLFPPLCTPKRSLTLHFAPQSVQMLFVYTCLAIPGQKGIQNGSMFDHNSDVFVFFVMRPLRNMHRHEWIACAALPGSSISPHFELKKGSEIRSKKETLHWSACDDTRGGSL